MISLRTPHMRRAKLNLRNQAPTETGRPAHHASPICRYACASWVVAATDDANPVFQFLAPQTPTIQLRRPWRPPCSSLSLFPYSLAPSLSRSLSLSLVHVHSSTIPPSGSLARSLAGSSSGRRRCFARSLEVPRRWSSVFGLAPLPAPPNERTNGACGCQSHLPILHKLHPRRPSPSPCKFETSLAVGPFHLTAPGT